MPKIKLNQAQEPALRQSRLFPMESPQEPSGAAGGIESPAIQPQPTSAEQDSTEEMSEVLQGFKARAAREDQRYMEAVDSEYWVCLCFQTRAQVEEFMQRIGVEAWGDKYVDGLEVASKMGLTIEASSPKLPKLKVDPKLTNLAMPLKR